MSARKEFLRQVTPMVGKKPSSVEVDVSARIGEPSRVDISYPVNDKEAQNWVYAVEETFGRSFEIWVRPT